MEFRKPIRGGGGISADIHKRLLDLAGHGGHLCRGGFQQQDTVALLLRKVPQSDAKIRAGSYFQTVASDGLQLPGLTEVAAAAQENAALFSQMLASLGMEGPSGSAHLGQPVTDAQAKGLIPLVREARNVERRQVELAKRALAT